MRVNLSFQKTRIWIFILINLFCLNPLLTQEYRLIDSLSLAFYEKGEWQLLDSCLSNSKLNEYQAHSFFQRSSMANFHLGNLGKSDRMLRKALKLNSLDELNFTLQHDLFLLKGNFQQAIYSGKAEKGYSMNNLLSAIAFENGIKYSSNQDPGNLLHSSIMIQSRLGYRFHLKQFLTYNKQDYFWEDFNQFTYSLLSSFQLNTHFSLEIPFQFANYSSTINNVDKFDNSDIYYVQGNSFQKAFHAGLNVKYLGPSFTVVAGLSGMQANTRAGYDELYTTFTEATKNRVDTSNVYKQAQLNLTGQYDLYFPNHLVKINLSSFLIQNNEKLFINLRPGAALQISDKWWIYGEYWHKDNHMISAADAGIFVNNFNTQTQRVLASLQFFPNSKCKLEATWFTEWGTDTLYNRNLNYQSFFIHLTRFFTK